MVLNTYENLEVYQLAKSIVLDVYRLTNNFPKTERFGLINQLRRSSVSVVSNIVEGTSRSGRKDKLRFIEIAYGSLLELDVQLVISSELELSDSGQLKQIRLKINRCIRMLSGLRTSVDRQP